MRILCLLLFLPVLLSAQTRPKSEAERRAWASYVYKEAIENNDSLKLAEAYYLFGKLETITTGNYLRTRVWFLKSLSILEKLGPGYELARLHLWLGHLEQERGNNDQALMYYRKALKAGEDSGSDRALINAWAYLGNFYAGYEEFSPGKGNSWFNPDSAGLYYDKAEQLAVKTRDKEGLVEIAAAKEKLSMQRGKGIDHARMNRVVLNVTGQGNMVELRALLRLAESFIEKKDFAQAHLRLDKAKKIYEEHHSYDRDADRLVTSAFISFHEKQGEWKEAYELQKQQLERERRRGLYTDQARDVSELRELYNAEQMEIVLQGQEQELKLFGENMRLQHRSLAFLTLLLAVTGVSAVLFYKLYRRNRSISRQNAMLVKEQSHRFRNNLQVVSDLLTMQSSRIDADAAHLAMQESHLRLEAISLLHSKLYLKDKLNSVRLDRFLRGITDGVLRAFAHDHVEVSYSVKPVEITPDEALSLGLIMNELTTNACKYAFMHHPAPRYEVFADITGNELTLRVSDNGPARGNTGSGTSFGTKIIALQVSQLNGEYHFFESNGRTFEMKYKRSKPAMNGPHL
ncbi:MAG: sensor histidine kinase [Leadbetterella sp.]|nr:sensor histidine kinase [Leadbetterella sp.]